MTLPIQSLCDIGAAAAAGISFDALRDNHQWSLPGTMNVAELVCERHADGQGRLALIAENESGDACHYNFDQLSVCASRLAAYMLNSGVKRGDRVAVILPQRVETAVLHLAAQRIGAISLPLSILFGDDALRYRLQDSGTSFLIVANQRASLIESMRQSLPDLHTVLHVVEEGPVPLNAVGLTDSKTDTTRQNSFWNALQTVDPYNETVALTPEDPTSRLGMDGRLTRCVVTGLVLRRASCRPGV